MKKVLVIDGDGYNRRYMGSIIERLGFTGLLRSDVESGLRLLRLNMPDTVICGDNLGQSNPVLLCRTIKADTSHGDMPVHIVSRRADEDFRLSALAVGAYSVMMWPLSVRSFFNNLEGSLYENRRQNLRSTMKLPVLVTPEGETNGKKPRSLETHDFGVGGMYVKTPNPFPRGTAVNMMFSLPAAGAKLDVDGVVARANPHGEKNTPPGMGLMFQKISEDHRSLFSVVVERYLARGVF